MGYDPEAGMLQREEEAAAREERMTGGRMPRGDIDGEQPYKKPMGFTQRINKLVFVVLLQVSCHCEPVRLSGVAIPRLEGKCIDQHPKNGGSCDFWW